MAFEIPDYRQEELYQEEVAAMERAFLREHELSIEDEEAYIGERLERIVHGDTVWMALHEDGQTAYALFRDGEMTGFVQDDSDGYQALVKFGRVFAPLELQTGSLMEAIDRVSIFGANG